jgi:pimeloyl-ACP methyl ester carboxylesterase
MRGKVVNHRGCSLAFDVVGDGPPVVFIQGVGLHGAGWTPQVEGLSKRFRCVTFDNRGMARSQPVTETLSVPLMVEDVVAVMDAASVERAHLVGHSMGGLLALATALEHRARVASLSLLCTFARGRDVTVPRGKMLWLGIRTAIGTRRMRRLAFLEMVMPEAALRGRDRDALAAELTPIFGHDLGERPPIVMEQLRATGAYDATPRLGELTGIPTMVMSAAQDVVAPPALGRALAAGIEGARYVEIEDAGHGVTIQHAERTNQLLAEHLGG